MGIPFSPVSVLLMVTFFLAKSARRVFTMQMGELSTSISSRSPNGECHSCLKPPTLDHPKSKHWQLHRVQTVCSNVHSLRLCLHSGQDHSSFPRNTYQTTRIPRNSHSNSRHRWNENSPPCLVIFSIAATKPNTTTMTRPSLMPSRLICLFRALV